MTADRRALALGADLARILDDAGDDVPVAWPAPHPPAPTSDPRPPHMTLPPHLTLPVAGWWACATLAEQGVRCWTVTVSWPGLVLARWIEVSKEAVLAACSP
jgi:hypothetical protein